MNESASHDDGNTNALKAILSKLPIGGGTDQMEQGEQLHQQAQGYHFNPDNVAPPDVQKQLLDLLKWRDGVYREVSKKVEMIPGLSAMLEEFSTALNTCKNLTQRAPSSVSLIFDLRRLHRHRTLGHGQSAFTIQCNRLVSIAHPVSGY